MNREFIPDAMQSLFSLKNREPATTREHNISFDLPLHDDGKRHKVSRLRVSSIDPNFSEATSHSHHILLFDRQKKVEQNPASLGVTETTGLVSDVESDDGDRIHELYNLPPPRSCLYTLFVIFSSLAVFITGMMVLAQILNVAILKSTKGVIIQHILRVYVLVFCIMFILAELQFERFLKLVPSMKNWMYRGFLYSFVGIIGIEESYAALAEEYPQMPSLQEGMVSLFLRISSYAMFAVGLIYIAMGLLCLRGVWERLKISYDEQVKRSARGDTSLVV